MEFKYYKDECLAKLAWCIHMKRFNDFIDVYHGSNIEINEMYFVEGVWNGEFAHYDFDKSDFFCGSGCKLSDSRKYIKVCTPSHIQERIYSLKIGEELYISNSLPTILFFSGKDIDIEKRDYEKDFNEIALGLDNYKGYISLENGLELNIYYYCNLQIYNDLSVEKISKPNIIPFASYDDYKNRIVSMVNNIKNNALDYKRVIKYDLATTISKGYDSAAVAAIAKECGCKTVVTFNEPEKYADDSGEEIAKILGYDNIVMKNANEYLYNKDLIEADYVSSGELGTWTFLSVFDEQFKNKIVMTGARGDQIWEKVISNPNSNFEFSDFTLGTSLTEHRLKIGYIILPLPLYGATQWESINEISNSIEMEAYSIGGDYDRPIPRRILEEKNVRRDMFGYRKVGAGFNLRYDNLSRIKKRMSKQSFESFYSFYKNNNKKSIKKIRLWIKFLWSSKDIYLAYFLSKLKLPINYEKKKSYISSNPGAASYLFP